jgi:hypothetical protein
VAQERLLLRCHLHEVVRYQADRLLDVLVAQRWRQRPAEHEVDHLRKQREQVTQVAPRSLDDRIELLAGEDLIDGEPAGDDIP